MFLSSSIVTSLCSTSQERRSRTGTRERFRSHNVKMHRKRRSSFRVHRSSIHRSENSGDYGYVWTTFPLFLQPCMCILLIITLFPWLWAVHDTYCPIVVISSLFFSLIRIIVVFYTVWCAYHGKRIIWRRINPWATGANQTNQILLFQRIDIKLTPINCV